MEHEHEHEHDHCECHHRHSHCRFLVNVALHCLTLAAVVATLGRVETLRRHHMREIHGRK